MNAPAPTESVNADNVEAAIAQLEHTLDGLIAVVEEETTLMRAGKVKDATALETRKSELARTYMIESARIKASRALLAQTAPEQFRALGELHKHLQARLKINMTVLATAHAVSEGIIRGVQDELTRKSAPSTYSARGRANAPSPRAARPLALSRSI